MQDLLQHMHVDLNPTSGPVDEQHQHLLQQVAWNCGLCSALITNMLRQLVLDAHFRKADGATDPVFAPGEMLVFVGFALNRHKVPFQLLIHAALSWEPLLQRFHLHGTGLTPDMVSVRLANDAAGPTFTHGNCVRCPRYKRAALVIGWLLTSRRAANKQRTISCISCSPAP
jgi:hypothetical protein